MQAKEEPPVPVAQNAKFELTIVMSNAGGRCEVGWVLQVDGENAATANIAVETPNESSCV